MTRNEFWVVTTAYANQRQSQAMANLERFCEGIRSQGVSLLIAELRIGDADIAVPDRWADRVMRMRSDTLLWHKERLLNLGIASLPAECKYVAWIDGDILFENDAWVRDTRALLNEFQVAQPFEIACWLPEGDPDSRTGEEMPGFAASVARSSNRPWTLANYDLHGHPGFAWAARREFLDAHRLYDRAIMGMGDLIAAHAFADGKDYLRGRHFSFRQIAPKERPVIAEWGAAVAAATGGRLAATPGRALHLYHPPTAGGTSHLEKQRILFEEDFDPLQDIALDAGGCWQWSSDKPNLHRRVRNTFLSPDTVASPAS